MFRIIGVVSLSLLAMQSEALAGGDLFDDLFGPYLDRRDTVTPGAGNAKDTNAAVHVIDPWPPRVNARNFPSDGKRAVDVIRRYRQGTPSPAAPADPASPVPTGLIPDDAPAASSGR